MALNHFIPEIWASSLLLKFRDQAVWAGISNREYEGQLSTGNTIHIPGIVDVEIKDYKAAGRTTTADEISDTGTDLTVDQEKSFDFFVDDIDRAQSNYGFEAYTQSAATGLVNDADAFLANLAVTNGTVIGNTAAPTDAESAGTIVNELRHALNVASVPASDRVLVVNPYFETNLVGWDSKLTAVDTSGDSAGLREATIGRLSGFDVIYSTALSADAPQAVAMHRSALAFVSQINQTEGMRAENKFADRIRGLHVYGAKALRPTAIQVFTASAGV